MTEKTSREKTKPSHAFYAITSVAAVLIGVGLVSFTYYKDTYNTTYHTHERINTALSSADLWPGDKEVFLASYLSSRDWIITSVNQEAFTYFKDGDFYTLEISDKNLAAQMSGRYITATQGDHCPDKATAKHIDQLALQHADNMTQLSSEDITYCYYDRQNITAYNLQKLSSLWSDLKFDIMMASVGMHNDIRRVEDFRHKTDLSLKNDTSSVDG